MPEPLFAWRRRLANSHWFQWLWYLAVRDAQKKGRGKPTVLPRLYSEPASAGIAVRGSPDPVGRHDPFGLRPLRYSLGRSRGTPGTPSLPPGPKAPFARTEARLASFSIPRQGPVPPSRPIKPEHVKNNYPRRSGINRKVSRRLTHSGRQPACPTENHDESARHKSCFWAETTTQAQGRTRPKGTRPFFSGVRLGATPRSTLRRPKPAGDSIRLHPTSISRPRRPQQYQPRPRSLVIDTI